MNKRALKAGVVTAAVSGALALVPAGPAAAQQVCPPLRTGITVTVAGQDVTVPGHGVGCVDASGLVPEPNVYRDGGTWVISLYPSGSHFCLFGINGGCTVALES